MTSCFCFIELYLTKTKREYRKNKLCIVYCKVFSILRLYMTFCQNYRCAQQDVLISCICGLMLMNSAMNVITMELTQFFILIEITICLPCLCVIIKYLLRLACFSDSKSDIYTYEQEELRKYSTTFSGTSLKPFCINKFIHVNNRNPSS